MKARLLTYNRRRTAVRVNTSPELEPTTMPNSSTCRVTVLLALVIAASSSFAQAQRRSPAPPNFDAFYELGPDSLIRRGVR